MKVGVRVGLGLGHIVLDGDPTPPPPKGTHPNFRPIFLVAKWLDELRCHLDVGPGHIVRDRQLAPPQKKGHSPQFSAMSIVAKRLDG